MNSVFLLCLDTLNEGSFFSPHLAKSTTFSTLTDFLMIADRYCDEMVMPQHAMEPRNFGKQLAAKRYNRKDVIIRTDPAKVRSKGKMATFIITVLFRHNASWQGTVRWIDGKQEAHFRSTLELLQLINGVFQSAASDDVALDAVLDAGLSKLLKNDTGELR